MKYYFENNINRSNIYLQEWNYLLLTFTINFAASYSEMNHKTLVLIVLSLNLHFASYILQYNNTKKHRTWRLLFMSSVRQKSSFACFD